MTIVAAYGSIDLDLVFAQGPPKFTINLTGSEEVPPVQTNATGTAEISAFDISSDSVSYGINATNIPGVTAALIVEVISPTPADDRRDRIDKADDYARFGVRWYWLIDPAARTLEILELAAGRYVRVLLESHGRLDAVPGCPELSLDLDALWAEVDELAIDPA